MPYDAAHGRPSEPVGQPSDEVGLEAFERAITERERNRQTLETTFVSIDKAEIVAVEVPGKSGAQCIATDEQPGKARLDKIPLLKPAFAKDGTVTAANASSISDGAAALVLMRASTASARGIEPLARIDAPRGV